jgi:cob(I)alamin adenosyltransferase
MTSNSPLKVKFLVPAFSGWEENRAVGAESSHPKTDKGLQMKGYIQVYTGDGKGKTTAALGLALRAAGAGLKVFVAQFLKLGDYSEITALKRMADLITVEQFGLGRFIRGVPEPEDIAAARRGLARVQEIFAAGRHAVVILDEANVAAACGLFSPVDLMDLISVRPEGVEVVLTGRNAAAEILARADLVTEMKALKHYYQEGVAARVGIEK